ncbi:hypothetical protein [Bradyrhizobium cytisi]|uniref:Uncharacterized protein n=1 Tax=Bradyrhizobium cytisi TaxID=515489 RepID=A0A5S4X2U4_9BRAD|nr:hypothetical protein [Bradyrhizobium cytisi]TYL87406.1 hypothetical protein FXB38_04595 [Bradyrhizobium cytisi]
MHLTYSPDHDIRDGEPWNDHELLDVKAVLARGGTIEEAAELICRAGTVEDVRRKAAELGLINDPLN